MIIRQIMCPKCQITSLINPAKASMREATLTFQNRIKGDKEDRDRPVELTKEPTSVV